jgi:hypothetical protein
MQTGKAFIDECPHYNSLTRYMEEESLTEHLQMLIEATSKPLASREMAFAVNSTGLGISNSVSRSRAKYKDQAMLRHKNWIKIHCCVGTHTNIIITAVEVTDKRSHDHEHFIPVMDATRKNFSVKEVSADAAYSSQKHSIYAEFNGFDSYIPFKDGQHHSGVSVWSLGSVAPHVSLLQFERSRICPALHETVERGDHFSYAKI